MDNLKYNKPNVLVQAKGNMTAIQQDILALAITKVDRDNKQFDKFYEIDIKEFSKLKNINLNTAHRLLHEAVKKFSKDTYHVGDKTITTGIISLKTRKGSSIIEVYFDRVIESIFFKTPYTQGVLKYLYSLKSSYSKRVYDLLLQYKNMNWQGKEKKRIFKIDELKGYLGIKNEYTRLFDFKKNVINCVVKEINKLDEETKEKLTDITITKIEYLRNTSDKRKVSDIEFRFIIHKNLFKQLDDYTTENEQETLKEIDKNMDFREY